MSKQCIQLYAKTRNAILNGFGNGFDAVCGNRFQKSLGQIQQKKH